MAGATQIDETVEPGNSDAAPPHTVPQRVGPYRGLVPYQADDEPYFRGRQREIGAVFELLFAGRLTIVYGESGVGKSSILRAGLVPKLRRHEMSTPILVADWHSDPVAAMHRELDVLAPTMAGESLADHLGRAVEEENRYVMVILDQFEELLRNVGRDDLSEPIGRLFDCIVELTEEDRGVSFLLALRADSVADLDVLLRRLVEGSTQNYRITPMSEANAREAITEPIDVYNDVHGTSIAIEDQLVDAITEGVSGAHRMPDGGPFLTPERASVDLPFLQIVMSRIWEEERRDTDSPSDVLRADTLQRLGGTERILAEHVDRILDELRSSDRKIAAELFDHLVTPTGAKVPFSAADLHAFTQIPEPEVQRVLGALSSGEARLLRTSPEGDGRVVYELFHDRLSGPVAEWSWAQRQAEERLHQIQYRRKVFVRTAIVGVVVSIVLGVVLARLLSDEGPPLARVERVTIGGSEELDATRLFDGDESEGLVIPADAQGQIKIEVVFADRFDIVDVQVVPVAGTAIPPPPIGAFIAETRIEVPVGDVRPVGRGAFGRTNELTLILETQAIDPQVQIAELKFWRHG